MDDMLRIIVLTLTHGIMFFAGVGITLLTTRGRRQELDARSAALDTHELFLDSKAQEIRQTPRPAAAITATGRHWARPITPLTKVQPRVTATTTATSPAPRLHGAMSLADLIAYNVARGALRVQEQRQFVDLMATTQLRMFVRRTASVA